MLQLIENQLFDRMKGMVRHISPVSPSSADGLVAQVYSQMRAEFQLTPPLTLHSPAPLILAGVWSAVRESQIASGRLGRVTKEAISASVSQINACPYCVDAHTGLLQGASENDLGHAIRTGAPEAIQDGRTRQFVRWALATRSAGDVILATPPFDPSERPEAIGTALAFHYINRMVHVFLGDGLLPGPSSFRGVARQVFGATFAKRVVRRSGEPGASLSLLPDSPSTADLSWAHGNAPIASAWARFASVVEQAGRRVVPASIRDMLEQRLSRWRGEDPGLDASWMDRDVSTLDEHDRPMGRFVLTVALASYRIDPRGVGVIRRSLASDGELVEATAWAALQATRRTGDWLHGQL